MEKDSQNDRTGVLVEDSPRDVPRPIGVYSATGGRLHRHLARTPGTADGRRHVEEAQANVPDAFEAVVELYAEQGRALPASISLPAPGEVVWSEALVSSP